MPDSPDNYDIDDNQNVDANLAAFAAKLDEIDGTLGPTLAILLEKMSRGTVVDRDHLWDELFDATAPSDAQADDGSAAPQGGQA